MCPQVGYEADTGVEIPPTGLTPVGERRVDCVVSSSLSCRAFFYGGVGTLKLEWRTPLWIILRQSSLPDAAFSQVVTSMLKSLRASLYRLRCPPIFLPPRLSSPYNRCLGIRESDIRRTWLTHRVCALRMVVMTLGSSALSSTSVLGSCLASGFWKCCEDVGDETAGVAFHVACKWSRFHSRREVLLRRLLCRLWFCFAARFLFFPRLSSSIFQKQCLL